MFMQILATLFIGGFVTLAVIGHVALFHALFFHPAEPAPRPRAAGPNLRLVPMPERAAELAHDRQLVLRAAKPAKPALKIA
jgi:hypothetical protein